MFQTSPIFLVRDLLRAKAGDGLLVLEDDDPATLRALIKYMYGVPYIAHSPYQQHNESTFIGKFFNPDDEDARKLNDLYKTAHKYCVWSLEWDILVTFSEYIELGYSGGKFFKAIELAYQMNENDHWLHAYIERACKHNIKQLVQDLEFFEMLKRTPQLSVILLDYAVGRLDNKGDPRHEGLRLRCPGCRQFFTLHKSHVPDNEWMCGWCRYRAPAGARWDKYS